MSWAERVESGPPAFCSTDGQDAPSTAQTTQDGLEHRCINGHNSLWAATSFTAGQAIRDFGAEETLLEPNFLTMQVSQSEHIILSPPHLLNINHSCDPNTFWDTKEREVYALRDIPAGVELTFFYPSTEWHMGAPFHCRCGTAACLDRVAGAKHMSQEQRARYRLNAHILELAGAS